MRKFNDALAKHGMDRRSLEPAKGLDEVELLSLASNPDAHFGSPWSEDLALLAEKERTIMLELQDLKWLPRRWQQLPKEEAEKPTVVEEGIGVAA
ncbi:hypothetical protein BHM03_00031920 [Ensete ventricosum]|nr:hypothetical protein BHM03_00031920 [Ensete ventricosum]